MIKTYEFKLFRNKKKFKTLEGELRVLCHIYNHCIRLIKTHYKVYGKNPSKNTLQKHLVKLMKDNHEWKALGYSQAIQNITDRIYLSWEAFFSWVKKKEGPKRLPPKFRSFRKYKSYTLKQAAWKIDEENGRIKLGPNWYRYNNSRRVEGVIKTVTVKRDSVGDFYIFLACEISEDFKPKKIAPVTGKSAGIDFGLKTFLTTSGGEEIQSPEFFKKARKNLKKKGRKLSSKEEGSKNRSKARKSLARVHRKIARQRKDFHFKTALMLINKYDKIFVEDLNLQGMKKLWGRKISDLALGDFYRILEFKANEHYKHFGKIDRFFPSSKTCCVCKKVKAEIPLSVRVFECECGNRIGRDKNAARNILEEGTTSYGLERVSPSVSKASLV